MFYQRNLRPSISQLRPLWIAVHHGLFYSLETRQAIKSTSLLASHPAILKGGRAPPHPNKSPQAACQPPVFPLP